MSGTCRKSPIGRKSGSVNVFPEDAVQLELMKIVIRAGQDQSWRGTNVTAKVECPGLRKDFNVNFPNDGSMTLNNGAGVVVGKYQGKATFSWPNGGRLVVTFNYTVSRL
jgi:hypothetical protein